jgi:S-formylglutathione hydrolase FrmB
MMIGADFITPVEWIRAGHAIHTIDDFASAHGSNAPVLVFVDATGAFNSDTECVNGSRGKAANHLTKDVVPYVISNFRVSADPANWGIVAFSMGATCAIDLTVMHPDLFSAFVDIAGDAGPNVGTTAQTIATLFGGANAYAAFDPTTVITTHRRYEGCTAGSTSPAFLAPRTVTPRRPVSARLRSAPMTPSLIPRAETSPPTRCAPSAAHTASGAPS